MPDQFDPLYKWLGIPPAEQPPDHYRLLGITRFTSDSDVIENAADQRMAHLRTFSTGQRAAVAQDLLNKLSAAKLCLLTADKRLAYDQQLKARLPADMPQQSRPDSARPATAQPVAIPLRRPQLPSGPLESLDAANLTTGGTLSARRRNAKPNRLRQILSLAAPGVVGLAIAIAFFLPKRAPQVEPASQPPAETSPDTTISATKTGADNASETAADQSAAPADAEQQTQLATLPLEPLPDPTVATSHSWERGKPPLVLSRVSESFIVTSHFSGYFLGNGEWYNIDTIGSEPADGATANRDTVKFWRLIGGGVQAVSVIATEVKSPYRSLFEPDVESHEWRRGKPPIKLIHSSDGFAVLSGANGCFLGKNNEARVYLSEDDGCWYLSGDTNFDSRARAHVYRCKQPGKCDFEIQTIDMKPGFKQTLFEVSEGICFVSRINGAFHGYGERLVCRVDETNHWELKCRAAQGSTNGSAVAIRWRKRP